MISVSYLLVEGKTKYVLLMMHSELIRLKISWMKVLISDTITNLENEERVGWETLFQKL